MSDTKNDQNLLQDTATTGKDSLGKVLRRNLSVKRIGSLVGRGLNTLTGRGLQAVGREVVYRYQLATKGDAWWYRADIPLKKELRAQRRIKFAIRPLISVVVPLYNTKEEYLVQLIKSVLAQSYTRWELVLVDGSDKGNEKRELVQKTAKEDKRVCYSRLYKNAGIAANTNIGLAEANGDYIILLDHDDVLQSHALYEVVKAVNETGADLIYSDEIVLDGNLKKLGEYHFKPDYGPDTLRGCNYFTHLCAFHHELLDEAGPESSAYDGAQDYDLFLRMSEKARIVHHIPKVLYFWRRHEHSTASDILQKPYALAAGEKALNAHLKRVKLPGKAVMQQAHPGSYRVKYEVRGNPLVSVLIPNKDHTDDLERCVSSLYQKAGWDNIEVLVIENNSNRPETEVAYQKLEEQYPTLRVVRYKGGFNFAAICNFGAGYAKGEHLLLLNNDVELLTDDYVYELLSYSQRQDVGAVGNMLYYPDDTVQHAGLFIGIGGTAGVNHKGHDRGDGGDLFRLSTVQNMSAVTGASLMVKTSLYNDLGGMDEENFGVAFNDVDLCLRLQEQGYWNVFTPFAEGYHFESKSRGYDTEGPAKERFDKEAAAFKNKYARILQEGDPFYNPHFTLETENYAYK
ncbi:MAG: glycosyltransferase family 2 protein [Oscillospiraceae bacterium]